jgi:hypothetical protein
MALALVAAAVAEAEANVRGDDGHPRRIVVAHRR